MLLACMCLASLCTCGEGVQFYCPSRTYTAIPCCVLFQFLGYDAFLYFLIT